LEVSPDGSVIGAAYWAAEFSFLNATNLQKTGLGRFRKKVYHLSFSSKEKIFATAGPDHVALWSFTLPTPSLVWTQAFRDVTGLSFAPDGRTFAFATKDQRVFVYDTATRTMQKTMTARGEPSEVVFNPDGTQLAVSHWNGAVAIYDPASGAEITVLTNHTMWVASLAFSRTDPILATSSADQRIRLWNTTTWKEMASFKGHMNLVDSVAVSPDGRWLASGSKDRSARIWNLDMKALSEVSETFTNIRSVAISPLAEFVAMVNSDATLTVWDVIGRREAHHFPVEPGTGVLATSPNGKTLVLGHSKSHKVWLRRIDAETDIPVEGADAGKSVAAFSLDGTQFAVCGREEQLRVGMTDGSGAVRELKHTIDQTTQVLFSPDGRQVFVANESGMVRSCDVTTGEKVVSLRAHEPVVAGIAFDVDGLRLATASADGTVGLWDAATREKLRSYGKTSLGYRSVSFSRDGRRIAASSGEGPVRVWDVALGQEVARFKSREPALSVRFSSDDQTLVIATASQVSFFRAPTFAEIDAAEANRAKDRAASAR
jgi:WD40 repeat protein